MSDWKKQLQLFGENYVSSELARKGYQILSRNKRIGKFEIDIIATKGRRKYLVEVRTSSLLYKNPTHYFPMTKLITLLAAQERFYPDSEVLCVLIKVIKTNIHSCMFYTIEELL